MVNELNTTSPQVSAGRRPLITVVAVVTVVAVLVTAVITLRQWSLGSDARADALDSELFVPILVTPSVQVADGQVLLLKITNVSDSPRGIRLMLHDDEQAKNPSVIHDFPKVGAAMTVSYVYEPATGQVKMGDLTVEGPRPVRAILQPLEGDDPGAVRNFIAAAQIVRLKQEGTSTRVLDVPVVVPVEHCTWEARGFMSHTGGRWHWNCAPERLPINPRRHEGGLGPSAGMK